MTFLYPLAFLVLLAIPVLIIIYILRNKYKEARVSSTYLWEVSQKFLKKRNPLNRFEHLLALIIQSLTIAALAVCLAHPQITLKGQADNIVFVLDGSASMQIMDGETTRFEKARTRIKEIEEESKDGSKFTLILTGPETKTVCQSVEDKSRFEMYLDSVTFSDLSSDLDSSMSIAQKLLSEGVSNKVYLATDKFDEAKKDESLNGVELIDVSSQGINYAIQNVGYSFTESDKINITGDVYGYGYTVPESVKESTKDEDKKPYSTDIRFYINGDKREFTRVFTLDGQKNSFSVTLDAKIAEKDVTDVKAVIENKDVLDIDNSFTVFNNASSSKTSVLLVGKDSNFIKGVFYGSSDTTLKTISSSAYTGNENYDITIFNCFNPTVLPKTGAAWFIGCDESVAGSDFIAQDTYDVEGGDYLTYTDDNSLLYQELTKKTIKNEILISQYTRYSLMGDFTSILTYNNLPVVFAGKNSSGLREVVIGFDLETSNFPMKFDFLRLLTNFKGYSAPKVMKKFEYKAGEEVVFSLPDNLEKITITTPSAKEVTIEKGNDDYSKYTFEETGSYDIKTTYTNSSSRSEEMKAYTGFPLEEGDPLAKETKKYELALKADAEKGDAIYDSLLWVVIACAVLFATDWILYAHEQY